MKYIGQTCQELEKRFSNGNGYRNYALDKEDDSTDSDTSVSLGFPNLLLSNYTFNGAIAKRTEAKYSSDYNNLVLGEDGNVKAGFPIRIKKENTINLSKYYL